jgi:hypothetical protein
MTHRSFDHADEWRISRSPSITNNVRAREPAAAWNR